MLFSIEEFFLKKSRAELFDCGVVNDTSKVTHVSVHRVDTILLLQFALVHFPSRRLPYASICFSIF